MAARDLQCRRQPHEASSSGRRDPWVAGPGQLWAALPVARRLLAEQLQAHNAADTTTEDRLTVIINSLGRFFFTSNLDKALNMLYHLYS